MTFGDYMLSNANSYSVLQPEQELKLAHYLINQVADAVFYVGSNAKIVYVNDAICRMMKYSREELLSMTLKDMDVDFWPKNWSEKWIALKQQGSLTLKTRYRTKTARIFLVEINITYVEYQGKEFGCVFARDRTDQLVDFGVQQYVNKTPDLIKEQLEKEVTEYKRTETELEKSLSLLRSTLESTRNGIVAVNFEGEVFYYNQKFLEMWQFPSSVGMSRKSSTAKAFFENKVKEPEVFCQAIWEMSTQSDQESYELVELNDGRIFAHYSEPQRLGEKIIGRVWSVWDVTESRKTEECRWHWYNFYCQAALKLLTVI